MLRHNLIHPSRYVYLKSCLLLFLWSVPAFAQLKINEVYYDVNGDLRTNQFIELYNSGSTTSYLDGMIITDEANPVGGTEGVFQFPGSGTTHPVLPGAFVLIAIDAGDDGVDPDLSTADWEFYEGGSDFDNPSVSNLTLVSGGFEPVLSTSGDNVILADGSDISAPIDTNTIIDGMNFENGSGELANLSSSTADGNGTAFAPQGYSLNRCSDGDDGNASSLADFSIHPISPGTTNNCGFVIPAISIADITSVEGDDGSTNFSFRVALSESASQTVTVDFATADNTAINGDDYTAAASTLTFLPGSATQLVTISVASDTVTEGDRSFFVNLSTAVDSYILDSQGSGTIIEDDFPFVSQIQSGNAITNTWTALSGYSFRVQYTTNLVSPNWITLSGDITASTTTASKADTITTNTTRRIYRLIRLY